jgi:hypothetical protein
MFMLLGCKNDHQIKIGSYKSVTYNKFDFAFQYLFKGINSAFVGSEINLKNDSSFVYTTCGNIMKGSYYVKNDSLFLKVKSNRFRIDSLNDKGINGHFATVPINPIKFKIDNEYLFQIHHLSKKEKIIEKLKFNVP